MKIKDNKTNQSIYLHSVCLEEYLGFNKDIYFKLKNNSYLLLKDIIINAKEYTDYIYGFRVNYSYEYPIMLNNAKFNKLENIKIPKDTKFYTETFTESPDGNSYELISSCGRYEISIYSMCIDKPKEFIKYYK